MVTGGDPKSQAVKTEVIDAKDPTKTCNSLPDFPYQDYWMANGGVLNGKIIVCQAVKCFQLQNNGNGWTEFATNTNNHKYGAGTVVNDALFVFAGYETTSSPYSEFVYSNGSTEHGPDLDITTGKDYGMCLVTLSSGNIMVMGGYKNAKRVGLFNPTTGSYISKGGMNFERKYSACTVFYSAKHGNREVVYVGGGYQTDSCKTAELLDYTVTEEWEQSKLILKLQFH